MIKKYRKKPVEITAVQFSRYGNLDEIRAFVGDAFNEIEYKYYISTIEGNMLVSEGDYIIKGLAGEFYPCKEDIFLNSYEEV